jgi:hypothetical protein
MSEFTISYKSEEYLCNLCGETCLLGHGEEKYPHGMIDACVGGGYESTPGNGCGALDDLTSYTFSLCEFCLDYMFTQFKIPPRVWATMNPEEEPWVPAAERVTSDPWRQQKEVFFTEKSRRDNLRKQSLKE